VPDELPVGVLALQGDFELHEQSLGRQGIAHKRVRRPGELAGVRSLIIPGGESTTMTRLIDKVGLRQPILDFAAAGKSILGTCAGLIMLATRIEEEEGRHGVRPLGLLDMLVRRNGYGRQVESFIGEVELVTTRETIQGAFIRAPRVLEIGNGIEILARCKGEIVGVKHGAVTGLAYHPEVVTSYVDSR